MTDPAKPWTMQQIAAAAGVSVTTVSHTLSGKRPVSAGTAERIRRLIDEFGYVPDAGARHLKSGRSEMIGLAVPDISHWYFGRIARGVEEMANEHDYGLIVCSTSNSDPRREKRYFNLLRTRSIEGLIYTASREMSATDELMSMAASSSPIVLADEDIPELPGIPSVTSTNYVGAQLLGQHLRSLGHTRAVILGGFAGLHSTVQRVRGIRESFPHALVLHGDFEIQSGYDLVSDLLAHEARFTALFACNDFMAIGAMRRLWEEGIRVPDDVSVVGFDDVDMASVVTPGLTTVRQDMLEIGRRSALLLLDGLAAGTTAG
ncbi:MAG: LacI family DNA-binding transcriptional regulator, partial [Herbiconiux sp.]|nr:LacI family DNA-binding transcriptional regulator [Herbiconiux sp.]